MIRYSIKQFWRMNESNNGEWVSYKDAQEEIERLKAKNEAIFRQFNALYDLNEQNQKEKWSARKLNWFLRQRIAVLVAVCSFWFFYAAIRLVLWSFGL